MAGYWFVLLAALAWSLPPNLARPAVREGVPPLAATATTAAIAIPLGYAVIIVLGRRRTFRNFTGRNLFFLGLTGLASTGGFFCMYAALATESIAVTVALLSTYPLWNLLLVRLFEREERITWRVVVGTLAIIAGVAIVLLP